MSSTVIEPCLPFGWRWEVHHDLDAEDVEAGIQDVSTHGATLTRRGALHAAARAGRAVDGSVPLVDRPSRWWVLLWAPLSVLFAWCGQHAATHQRVGMAVGFAVLFAFATFACLDLLLRGRS